MGRVDESTAVVENSSQYVQQQKPSGQNLHSRMRADSKSLFIEMNEEVKQQDKEVDELVASIIKENVKIRAGLGLNNDYYQFESNMVNQEDQLRQVQMRGGPLA